MTRLSPDARRLVQALRQERTSEHERARLRARVLRSAAVGAGASAGLASTGLAATAQAGNASGGGASVAAIAHGKSALAAVLTASPATLGGKLAALGLGVKVSALAVLAVAAPVLYSASSSREPDASARHSKVAEHAPAPVVWPRSSLALPVPASTHERAPEPLAERLPPAPVPAIAAASEPASSFEPPRRTPALRLPAPARPEPPAQASTIAAESALIERALAALRDGALAQAHEALARHAARYPDGVLAPERERTRKRLQGQLGAHSDMPPASERNVP